MQAGFKILEKCGGQLLNFGKDGQLRGQAGPGRRTRCGSVAKTPVATGKWPHKNPPWGHACRRWYVPEVIAELASEDALRLAVLMTGEVHAVRIDEGRMELLALTPRGEARVALHANCRPENYLTRVRETLGGHALGSPGGYPVHLRRWTRMGQASARNLEALLKLGEPEAVAAVAHAPALSDELARRAWWALPTVELARVMLGHQAVREGAMGRVLAGFLIDYLPFEADPVAAMNMVRAVLASGLLDEAAQLALWQKGRRRPHYLIGFLECLPDRLPADRPTSTLPATLAARPDNPWVQQMFRCASPVGQAWLQAAELALDKPPAHEAVYLLLDLIGRYFGGVRDAPGREALAGLEPQAAALEALAQVGSRDAEDILLRTTAVGPLLRRKIDPLVAPLLGHLRLLQGLDA